MSAATAPEVIDLHSHYTHPDHPAIPPPGADPALGQRLVTSLTQVADADAQVKLLDERGIDVRVLGAPPSLFHPGAPPPPALLRAVNDGLAAHVARHPSRFVGFASIDAFDGQRAALEVQRAIGELGLGGIVVDSTDGSALVGGPESRPTLETAGLLGVPVFVHPTSSTRSLVVGALGASGIILDRGFNNAASLLSVAHHRITRELPTLRLLFAGLAAGGLAAIAQLGIESQLRGAGDGGVYIDTMGFAPSVIRLSIEVLGSDRVVVGTDWPIQDRDASRERLAATFGALSLDAEDVARISAGNARRFLAR